MHFRATRDRTDGASAPRAGHLLLQILASPAPRERVGVWQPWRTRLRWPVARITRPTQRPIMQDHPESDDQNGSQVEGQTAQMLRRGRQQGQYNVPDAACHGQVPPAESPQHETEVQVCKAAGLMATPQARQSCNLFGSPRLIMSRHLSRSRTRRARSRSASSPADTVLVADAQDIVEHGDPTRPGARPQGPSRQIGRKRKFLSIWFRCCHVYGRLYRNAQQTTYQGRCPRCGAFVRALIEPGGTDRRMFEAR